MSVKFYDIKCDECGSTEWDSKGANYYCRNCGIKMSDEKIERELQAAFENHKEENEKSKVENKNIYMINGDSTPEWVVATTKYKALEYITSIWGLAIILEYFQEAKEDDLELTYEEWIEEFVKKEDLDKEFTMYYEDGSKVTKKISEWLKDAKEVPSYFACSE